MITGYIRRLVLIKVKSLSSIIERLYLISIGNAYFIRQSYRGNTNHINGIQEYRVKKIKYKTSLHRGNCLGSFKRIKYEVLALQSGVYYAIPQL